MVLLPRMLRWSCCNTSLMGLASVTSDRRTSRDPEVAEALISKPPFVVAVASSQSNTARKTLHQDRVTFQFEHTSTQLPFSDLWSLSSKWSLTHAH